MKSKTMFRGFSLLILLISLFPSNNANAMVSAAPPPADMFQLPWDQGIAWYAIDGIDNGSKRPASSSHSYRLGGAIDFAPRTNMVTGENTSNFWVTAAASGTVVATSTCYVTLSHANGWVTQYQFLGNIQVKLGDAVARNQRIGVIADGVKYKYCPGYQEINVPHVHFMLRPSMIDASFAGWQVKYNSLFNSTTFTKNGQIVGLRKLLLNVMDAVPTPSPTPGVTATALPPTATSTPPSGPYVSTETNLATIDVGQTATVTVRLNNVPVEGYTSAELTCPYSASLIEVSNIVFADLFGADPATVISGPQNGSFIAAIAGAAGNKATTSGAVFSFSAKGLQAGQTALDCTARVSKGDNVLTSIPSLGTSITILGTTPTQVSSPTATLVTEPPPPPTETPAISTTSPTSTPDSATATPGGPTQTPIPTSSTPGADWLGFLNVTYEFSFRYPFDAQLLDGWTDNYARINLPIVQGTNLREKYLEMIVVENSNPCQSPLATSSMLQSSETVVIAGITWLKQTGGDGAAGNLYQWVAYSTSRDNVCVSLDFVLHSLNPGNFPTPPPVFDFAAESAVFGQIVATYSWLSLTPTNTPTSTPTATGSLGPTFTPTASSSPTPSGGNAAVTGQITASKPIIVNIYDTNTILVATMETNPDGTFRLEVPPGTYTVVAISHGFLRAQATETIAAGITRILPHITLSAGDIDGNGVIDQFDALTIGMNYNATSPEVADLNDDGIINVLDLEALAKNYRKTGPVPWS